MVSGHRRFSSDSQDFEFNKYSSNDLELPYPSEESVASADELFYKGQLLPLHRVICLSPPSPSSTTATLCATEQFHHHHQQQQKSQNSSSNSARYKLSIRDQQFSSCRMDDIQFLDIFDEARSSSFRLQSPDSPRFRAQLNSNGHSHSHIRHASLSSINYNYNPASSTYSATTNWDQFNYQYPSSSISTSCTSQDQSSCSSRDSNSSSQDYPTECNPNCREEVSSSKHNTTNSSSNSRRSRRSSFVILQSWKLLLNSALQNKKKSSSNHSNSVRSLIKKIKPLMKIKPANEEKKKGWFGGFTRESTSTSISTASASPALQRRFSQSAISQERRPKLSVQFVRPRFRSVSTSCPASALASPNHSGLLSPHCVNAPINSYSSMQELHSAIQGAIAHCKQSFSSNTPPTLGPST